MRLTTYSDYSIRVLVFLGIQHGKLVKISDIAYAHSISENHLTKVVLDFPRFSRQTIMSEIIKRNAMRKNTRLLLCKTHEF